MYISYNTAMCHLTSSLKHMHLLLFMKTFFFLLYKNADKSMDNFK